MILRTLALMTLSCAFTVASAEPNLDTLSIPALPFFGQSPPDTVPALFAPGMISDAGYRLHGTPSFSPNGDEVFWPVVPPKLMHSVLTGSGWSSPEEVTFGVRGIGSPSFTLDGKRLYFQGIHSDGFGSVDLWYVEKTDTGWSSPHNAGSPPNSESLETQPSLSLAGDLIYTGKLDGSGMDRGIYYCRHAEGKYDDAVLLDSTVNSSAIDYTPFLSRDGTYLLFSSSRPGVNESDLKLYISFRDSEGAWSEPKDLSQALHIEGSARFPQTTCDSKFLFFLSDGRVYWVSTANLKRMRMDSRN
jgi:hypothetical protein